MEIIGPYDFKEFDAYQQWCILKEFDQKHKAESLTDFKELYENIWIAQQDIDNNITNTASQKMRFKEQLSIWNHNEKPWLKKKLAEFFANHIPRPYYFMHIEDHDQYTSQDHIGCISSLTGRVAYNFRNYTGKSTYIRKGGWGIFVANRDELEGLKQEIILEWKLSQ